MLWCRNSMTYYYYIFKMQFGQFLLKKKKIQPSFAQELQFVAVSLCFLLTTILMETSEVFSLLNSYGYSKERFVWSLISAVGIFCLGSGATIVNGIQNLWTSQVTVRLKFESCFTCYHFQFFSFPIWYLAHLLLVATLDVIF